MSPWFWVLFWWLLFGATHVGLSAQGVRRPLVARLGARGYQGLYSLIALGTFVMLVRSYFWHRHAGPLLWNVGAIPSVRHLAMLLPAAGVALLVGSFMQPSPVGMGPAKPEARGLTKITRHPFFCAFALWGLGHAIVNGFLADVIFFGGFVVFFVVGAMHQDARKRREEGERLESFYAETSVLPFAAVVSGRTHLTAAELPWAGLAIGLAAAVAIYLLHPQLFGV